MLNKIMEECIKYKKDNLYVIHNLKEFEEKEQVIDYIQNILMKSGTFDLEKKNEIVIQDNSNSGNEGDGDNSEDTDEKDEKPIYYISKYKSLTVYHLIYINDESSEKSYDEFAKKMIWIFINFCQRTKINISDSFKKAIYDLLKDYSINENQIRMTNIKDNNGKILCKGIKNLNLNFVDRPIKLNNDIKLKYNYYVFIEDEKSKIINSNRETRKFC